jgi:drug/metabolite transporter (DMT)-like permease
MGILAALFSAFFSTSKDVISKKLAMRIDGTASTFASFGFALPFYLVVLGALYLIGFDLFHFSVAFWWLVLLRALSDVGAEGMKMYSFAHGDIGLVTILFSLSPLFLLVLSPLLTDDPFSLPGAAAVGIVVLGSMALVYRPSHPDWHKQKRAMVLAVGAAVFFALNSVFDRMAVTTKSNDPSTAVVAGFTMTALSSVILLPMVLFRKDRLAGLYIYRRGLLIRGFLEVTFMVCKLLAMQHMAAPFVVGLQRTSLLLSVLAGRFVFKEGDFYRRLLAGFLVLIGVTWIVMQQVELKDAEKNEGPAKTKLAPHEVTPEGKS